MLGACTLSASCPCPPCRQVALQGEMPITTWHIAFCPLREKCQMGQKQTCCKPTADEVVEKLVWHLHASSYHYMS
eukprot:8800646-Alexandrium_andersonii.AAC.1